MISFVIISNTLPKDNKQYLVTKNYISICNDKPLCSKSFIFVNATDPIHFFISAALSIIVEDG